MIEYCILPSLACLGWIMPHLLWAVLLLLLILFLNGRTVGGILRTLFTGSGLSAEDMPPEVRKSELFQDMTPFQVRNVLSLGTKKSCKAGESVVLEGEYGKTMSLLLQGIAEVLLKAESQKSQISVAESGPGEVFGEVSLVEPGLRSASIKAKTDLTYMEFDMPALKRMIKLYPGAACLFVLNISRILAQRLANADSMIVTEHTEVELE